MGIPIGGPGGGPGAPPFRCPDMFVLCRSEGVKASCRIQCPNELLLWEIWSRHLWRMTGVLYRATTASPSCTTSLDPMHTRSLDYFTITTDCSTPHFYQLRLFSMIPESCSFSSS